MNLINCKKCGALFSKKFRDTCDKCTEIENKEIESIINFVKKSPKALIEIDEISKKLDISLKEIINFYKNGRINMIKDKLTIKCTICETYTKATEMCGHFCSKCSQEMMNERNPSANNVKDKKTFKPKIISKSGFKKSYD